MINKKINLLIVHSTMHIGGAEEVTKNICSRIDRSRFNVMVCYLKEKGVVGDRIEEEGTPVIGLPERKKEGTDYFTAFKLRRIIKKYNIDIVHSHDVHAFTDCSICKITMPWLKFVHTYHYGNYPQRAQPFKMLESLFWRLPTQLVSVSNKQQDGIKSLYRIPDKRIATLWNGVDVGATMDCQGKLDHLKKEGKLIIGSINTLIEQKGMFDLLKVASKLNKTMPGDYVFVIAGDGPLKEKLKEEIQRQGLEDTVYLLGWVNDAARAVLPYIDIFFQPSLWEAMSMVLLETMANSKAIVATDVGETGYIIEDNVHGRIVSSGDIESMVIALSELINNQEKRELLGSNAYDHYKNAFTAIKMTQRYEELYCSLVRGS